MPKKISVTIATFVAIVVISVLVISLVSFDGRTERGTPSHSELESDTSPEIHSTPRVSDQVAQQPVKARVFWELSTPEPTSTGEKLTPPTENAVYVRIADSPRNWVIGTDVALYIPQQDQESVVRVDKVIPHAFDNRTYEGTAVHHEHLDTKLIATSTGEDVLVYLSQGHSFFQLEAVNGEGWLIPSSDLNDHVDYSISDLERDPHRRYENIPYLPKDSEEPKP